ncbi:MAG TPA: cytochrome c oxidase accessory protein CcoG [Candidatus Didemnitutus sp.]|nr:cytochrome c oxidase accessory protein CcoG [Candidatus Didemnitutus sp.]
MSASPEPTSSLRRARGPGRHAPTRDSVTTINTDGSRLFLYPADIRGRFTLARRLVAVLLIGIYLLLPWIPVRGYPAVFLDVAARRFHFFGFTLASQDAWLLFFGVSGLGFALFFVTALLGRIWCGWACPHTVFLDHVFRRIERWIEGDATARRTRAAAPLTTGKALRVVGKHGLYLLAALGITHLFLAYFVSIPALWLYMREEPAAHGGAFVFVFLAAGILYFNFAWFREQLCIVICPYGRLQSALSDDQTLSIGYDARRGEPRARVGTPDAGACVDCQRCVQVCPTGIDIRHGLQMECIGCAACIDACDEVMMRLKRPTGLIRYDSLAGLGGGRTRWLRSRTILYGVLLTIGAAVATFAFSTVKPAGFLVYRMTGAAYFVDGSTVRNQFLVRLVNKRTEKVAFTVVTETLPPGAHTTGFAHPVTLDSLAESVAPLVVSLDRRDYRGPFKFTVRVTDAGRTLVLAREVEFMGPDARLLEEEDHEKGIRR